jgi:hypothetical protein
MVSIVETYAGPVGSITSAAESEGEQVVDVALSAAGVVTDTVGYAIDPLGAVLTAGVGWLLEHVSFLHEPLDALLGNPDEINANLDQLKSAALEMHTIAEEHRQAGRLAELAKAMQKLSQGLDRFATAGDLAVGAYQAAKPYQLPPQA